MARLFDPSAAHHDRLARNRETDRSRREEKPWRYWYGLQRWKAVRRQQLWKEPLCAFCLHDGYTVEATVCDHVERHRGDPELFWNGPFQSLCKTHHDATKQREEHRGAVVGVGADGWPTKDVAIQPLSFVVRERRMPSDLQPSAIPLTIVCGAPGSGKSTYIRERIASSDILIDLDRIQQELSGRPEHHTGQDFLIPALEERNARLRALAGEEVHGHAWFVVSAPDPDERIEWGRRLGGEVVTMDTPLDECIRRIEADPARQGQTVRMVVAAYDWWSRNGALAAREN